METTEARPGGGGLKEGFFAQGTESRSLFFLLLLLLLVVLVLGREEGGRGEERQVSWARMRGAERKRVGSKIKVLRLSITSIMIWGLGWEGMALPGEGGRGKGEGEGERGEGRGEREVVRNNVFGEKMRGDMDL